MADEWTTVTSKKRSAAVVDAPKSAAYVPPSMRAAVAARAAAEEAKKPLNFKSESLFPSLGGAAVAPKGAWASKTNFKQKVEELIEKDKQTAEEKAAAEEASRAMEGWVVLVKPTLNAETGEAWDNYIGWHNREERRIAALIDMGLYLEPIVEPRKVQPSRASRFELYEDEFEIEAPVEEEMPMEDHLSDLD
jgi:hypothetical protein